MILRAGRRIVEPFTPQPVRVAGTNDVLILAADNKTFTKV